MLCTKLNIDQSFTIWMMVEWNFDWIWIRLKKSLNYWGRVKHMCVSKINTIGSDNGLLPGWRQAIIWTNAGILFIGPLGTNFSEVFITIHAISFKKIHLKMSSGKWQPSCRSLNVLMKQAPDLFHILFCVSLVPGESCMDMPSMILCQGSF